MNTWNRYDSYCSMKLFAVTGLNAQQHSRRLHVVQQGTSVRKRILIVEVGIGRALVLCVELDVVGERIGIQRFPFILHHTEHGCVAVAIGIFAVQSDFSVHAVSYRLEHICRIRGAIMRCEHSPIFSRKRHAVGIVQRNGNGLRIGICRYCKAAFDAWCFLKYFDKPTNS